MTRHGHRPSPRDRHSTVGEASGPPHHRARGTRAAFPGFVWSWIDRLSPGSRFAAATGAVTLCVGLSYAADTSTGQSTGLWASLYLAVALAALIGGESPGLFATAVGAAAVITYAVTNHPPAGLPRDAVEVSVFLVTGILMSLAGGTLREARRRALAMEARLHLMADNAPVLMWMGTPESQRTWVNRSWLTYTGRTLQQEEGDGWHADLHPDDRAACLAAYATAVEAGHPFELEYRLRCLDGTYRWMVDRGVPIRDADGQLAAFVGSCTDIHDRWEAARERERLLTAERMLREDAERANLAKEEFLGVVSHELRTPLNAILGWSYLLRERLGDQTASRRALDIIERNARVQAQIVDDLLDMTRLTSGTLQLDLVPIDLRLTVEAAVEAERPRAATQQLSMTWTCPPAAVMVRGSAIRLQQVVGHLLANATKFTPPGGGIEVTLAHDDRQAFLAVRDTGRGITPLFLPHVFERFRQADASRTRRHGGLGIGLTLVKSIVLQHGGTVSAESAGPDLGTRFMVSLPLFEPVGRRAGDGLANHPRPLLARVHVLVVDDDPDTCELVRRLLEGFGAEVRTARSAHDALERWREERPDVLVSDIGMPDQDGYSLVREIRRLEPRTAAPTPAIALTAFDRPEDRRAALDAGFQRHLRKPVEPDDLVDAIARLAR